MGCHRELLPEAGWSPSLARREIFTVFFPHGHLEMKILPWLSLAALSLGQREGDVKLWHALDESKYDFGDRTGNSLGYGVLLVFYEGQWGSVCDTGFTQNSADVVCSQLGFTRAEKVRVLKLPCLRHLQQSRLCASALIIHMILISSYVF